MGVITTELWSLGAIELAGGIRDKRFSSREVVEAHLARIEAINKQVNAVTRVLADEALKAADAADRRLASGQPVGPLHGVPFTVKENIDLAGSATTQGVVALAAADPGLDAPQVASLREAGAIPLARTNMPDFGLRWHTDNALHGPTRNPWDPSRTPGGSSGGEAVALATGMTALGLGNDLGGSLRWPSQCNGTAAIRPTLGRVAHGRAIPPLDAPITLQLMAAQGPMARQVADLRLALEWMTRPSWRDPWHVPVPLAGPDLPAPIAVAVVVNPAGRGISAQVADGVMKAAAQLEAAGYAIEEVEPPDIAQAAELWSNLLAADLRRMWPLMSPMVSADANKSMSYFFDLSRDLDAAEYMQAFMARQAVARSWSEFQLKHPLILAPVCTDPPFTVGVDLAVEGHAAIVRSSRLLVAVNLLGLPSVALPVGIADGLPQAVQIIGPRYREDICLDAAEALEARCGRITPIDPR